MIRSGAIAIIAAALALPALPAFAVAAETTAPDAGLLGTPKVLLPTGPVSGAVFLFSDKDGWTAEDGALAATLQGDGAIVVGIDTTRLFPALEADEADECVYLVSDIEDLSHRIQRQLGTPNYHSPVLAGTGTGGALVLAIAAQTPDATIGHGVAADPALVLPLVRPLCTDAPSRKVAAGTIYGLEKDDLTNPVDVLYSPAAAKDARDHVAELQGEGFKIKTKDVGATALDALGSRLERILTPKAGKDDPLADLPLVELPATAKQGTMAIVYSGDGGWRDIDKSIGEVFQKEGVPTVGVDSLRYFWSKKTPQQTADDLARIIDRYTEAWGIDHIVLVGYSFGADVLPAAYNLLPADEKSEVSEVSLLGLSDQADYEISVGSFLGTNSGDAEMLPDLRRINPALVQCFYGEEEDDSLCPKLEGTGIELVKTAGGHHFDGDYEGLAGRIVDGLKRRLAGVPLPVADR